MYMENSEYSTLSSSTSPTQMHPEELAWDCLGMTNYNKHLINKVMQNPLGKL